MARPLRIECAGARYHLASRGDRREAIYEDDEDREMSLGVLAETVEGNLPLGMRHLYGVFTQASNRRHGRMGHLFQGRFKGILVDTDAYLLELSR